MSKCEQAILYHPDLSWSRDGELTRLLQEEGKDLKTIYHSNGEPPFDRTIIFHFRNSTVFYRHCLPTPLRGSSVIEVEANITAHDKKALDETVEYIRTIFPELECLPGHVSRLGRSQEEYDAILAANPSSL